MPGKQKAGGRGRGRPKDTYVFKFDKATLERFEDTADRWEKAPIDLQPFTRHELYIHYQALAELVRNPPPGRSGPAILLQAMKDFREVGAMLLEMAAGDSGKKA